MKDTEIIVYYVGDSPNTIYKVWNKPEIGENPYVTIEGWWLPEDNGSNKPTYHFVENQHKNLNKWDKEWLMNKIIPDRTAVKEFDSMNDFILDQI